MPTPDELERLVREAVTRRPDLRARLVGAAQAKVSMVMVTAALAPEDVSYLDRVAQARGLTLKAPRWRVERLADPPTTPERS